MGMNFTLWRIRFDLANRTRELFIRCNLARKAFKGENILFGVEIYPTPDGRIYFSHQTPINLAFTVICGVDFCDRSERE
jgi:hypothetical protein